MVFPQNPVPPVLWIFQIPGGKVPLMIPLSAVFLSVLYSGICVSVCGHTGVCVAEAQSQLKSFALRVKGSMPSPSITPCFEGHIYSSLRPSRASQVSWGSWPWSVLLGSRARECFPSGWHWSCAQCSHRGWVTVPARCFTQQRERRINIFDCPHMSNRESHPDSSHCAKITTAKLKFVPPTRKDSVITSSPTCTGTWGAYKGQEGEKSKIEFVPQQWDLQC